MTTVHVELGTAFWLLIVVLIGGLVVYSKLGSYKVSKVINSGIGDAVC